MGSRVKIEAALLVGKYTMTAIIVPSTGRMLALEGSFLDDRTVKQIVRYPAVWRDLVLGTRPNDVFQKGLAGGSGLVDKDGTVY